MYRAVSAFTNRMPLLTCGYETAQYSDSLFAHAICNDDLVYIDKNSILQFELISLEFYRSICPTETPSLSQMLTDTTSLIYVTKECADGVAS